MPRALTLHDFKLGNYAQVKPTIRCANKGIGIVTKICDQKIKLKLTDSQKEICYYPSSLTKIRPVQQDPLEDEQLALLLAAVAIRLKELKSTPSSRLLSAIETLMKTF